LIAIHTKFEMDLHLDTDGEIEMDRGPDSLQVWEDPFAPVEPPGLLRAEAREMWERWATMQINVEREIRAWVDFVDQYNAEWTEVGAVRCRCGRLVSGEAYSYRMDLCHFCNREVHPFMANPLNWDLVKRFMPHVWPEMERRIDELRAVRLASRIAAVSFAGK